ncbi:MAG: twin-arginine translocase TatA/TatE family subunit [Mariprofundaceae bacterium]
MGLGTTELILILVIVLVLFGARKLPEIGAGLAKGIKSFRQNMSDDAGSAAGDGSKPGDRPASEDAEKR